MCWPDFTPNVYIYFATPEKREKRSLVINQKVSDFAFFYLYWLHFTFDDVISAWCSVFLVFDEISATTVLTDTFSVSPPPLWSTLSSSGST